MLQLVSFAGAVFQRNARGGRAAGPAGVRGREGAAAAAVPRPGARRDAPAARALSSVLLDACVLRRPQRAGADAQHQLQGVRHDAGGQLGARCLTSLLPWDLLRVTGEGVAGTKVFINLAGLDGSQCS